MRAVAIAVAAAALAGCGREEDLTIEVPQGVERPSYAMPLGAALDPGPAREDPQYLKAFIANFTSLTPENAMKWENIHPSRTRYAFEAVDALLDFAERANVRVRGHPVVWEQQLPEWVNDAPRDQLEEILRQHVTGVVARYKGRIGIWDVVNEPLAVDGPALKRHVFEQAMGEGWIDVALQAARKADPRAKLYINEIAAERGAKAEGLVALARRLRKRGVPLDGIGIQNHTTAHDFPTRKQLAALFAQFAELGLDVEITEMDVSMRPRDPVSDQTAAYRAAAEACAAAPNCTGFTVWGVTDERSWKGADQRPLLIDASGNAKPSLDVVREVLATSRSQP